jgi:DNA-binding response OmpR family regulator
MRPALTRVLVVEDDPQMRAVYKRFFASWTGEGFAAEFVPDGEQALDALARRPVDLLVVDWLLPGLPGPSLVRAVRAHPRTRSAGVLMVTGRARLEDELAALEGGCDDYLSKPVDERRLLARLRSLRRRRELACSRRGEERYPGLAYDPHAGRVEVDGAAVRLTPKELDLLGVFLHRPGALLPASYLWEHAWGYESENWAHVLAATLSSLRRKLGPRWGGRLKALRGRGYLLDGL